MTESKAILTIAEAAGKAIRIAAASAAFYCWQQSISGAIFVFFALLTLEPS